MRILVTGANGYLGQGIIRELLALGQEVIAVDCNVPKMDATIDFIACNLFEVEDPYNYFHMPDILLHLAWRDGFVHYSDAHIEDLPGHYEFIKRMCDSDIKKIVVMGSMHEVGFFEGSIKDDTACNPVTPYGISKNALRNLTRMLCIQRKKDFMWLRGFYVVGNSICGSSIFSKIASAALKGEKTFPFTQGQNQFDFIDYDDFCYKTVCALVQTEISGIVNICSGHPEKLSERVERFIEENEYHIKLSYGVFPDRPYDSKAVWGDSTKIDKIVRKVRGEILGLS